MTAAQIVASTDDRYMTTQEVASKLGVCIRTIQLWCDNGTLPTSRTVGGHRRIRASAVQTLEHKMDGTPAAVHAHASELLAVLTCARNYVDDTTMRATIDELLTKVAGNQGSLQP